MVPEILVTDENAPMFEHEWLNECSEEIDFTQDKTEPYLAKINKTLAHRLRGEFSNKFRQQAIFELLGEDYTKLYFPHHQYSPELLRPPSYTNKKREETLAEMRIQIEEALQDSLAELGYPKDLSKYEKDDSLGEFLNEMRAAFKSGCDRQVQNLMSKERLERGNSIEDDVKSIASQASGEYEEPEKLGKPKQKESDVLAEGLVSIMNNNIVVRRSILHQFRSKSLMLPNPLRRSVWEGFINNEDDVGSKRSRRKAARDFKAEIEKKLKKSKGGRAVQSSDYKKIYSAVIDTYHGNHTLKMYAEDTHMLQTAHIINILNLVDKEYNNAQIFWALPFQIIYEKGNESRENEEKSMMEISCLLEKFGRHGPPSFKDISSLADKVIDQLKEDNEFYGNLVKRLDESIHASGYLYLVVPQILVANHPNKSEKVWADLSKKKKKDWRPKDHEYFGKLDLWIRKWISELFVGVLGNPHIFYIWDVLFLHKWTDNAMVAVCMGILSMLRVWLKQAPSNRELVSVLVEEPGKLYLQDLRNTILILQEEDCFKTGKVDLNLQLKISEQNTNVKVEERKQEVIEDPAEESENGEEEDANEENEGKEDGEEKEEDDKKEEGDDDNKDEEKEKEKEEENDEDKTFLEKVEDKIDGIF